MKTEFVFFKTFLGSGANVLPIGYLLGYCSADSPGQNMTLGNSLSISEENLKNVMISS